jgi:hypothetical protein
MRKRSVVIAAFGLALLPLLWSSTIAPPAQSIHAHDRSGQEITLARMTLSVPVAEAHIGSIQAETDDRARHVQHLVRVYVSGLNIHAECWAKNDGGAHDHSHRITACQLRSADGIVLTGGCHIAGSYGPCDYSMQDQHWHSETGGPVSGRCFRAVGGFDTVGHTHATIYAPRNGWWCPA